MKCLILAAGYATRLYPLTENFPKPLLKVGEKAILDWLVDDLAADPEIDEFIVVTNHKFAEHFVRWGETKAQKITVVDDGTSTNETRLGAVKDIQFALEQAGVDDDVFVMAGDNVLDFSLCRFIEFAKARGTSCVMCHEERELKKQQKTAIITIGRAPGECVTAGREEAEVRTSEADRGDRMCGEDAEACASEGHRGDPEAWGPADEDLITSYEEKPKVPKGHLAVPPFYFYRREDVKRIPEALAAGCGADAPGSFAAWLSRQVPMHAFVMPGKRYDVGDVESYREVCKVFSSFVSGKEQCHNDEQ